MPNETQDAGIADEAGASHVDTSAPTDGSDPSYAESILEHHSRNTVPFAVSLAFGATSFFAVTKGAQITAQILGLGTLSATTAKDVTYGTRDGKSPSDVVAANLAGYLAGALMGQFQLTPVATFFTAEILGFAAKNAVLGIAGSNPHISPWRALA